MFPKRKASTGQRGKYAEAKVREYLEQMNSKHACFAYERIYDARSAGGRGIPARPGDFEFYAPSLHGLIEVKEVEHDYRLPKKNLDKEQIAKLRKREFAGGMIFVLVYHTTLGVWRSVPIQWLHERSAQSSWDLREFAPITDAAEALEPLEIWLRAA